MARPLRYVSLSLFWWGIKVARWAIDREQPKFFSFVFWHGTTGSIYCRQFANASDWIRSSCCFERQMLFMSYLDDDANAPNLDIVRLLCQRLMTGQFQQWRKLWPKQTPHKKENLEKLFSFIFFIDLPIIRAGVFFYAERGTCVFVIFFSFSFLYLGSIRAICEGVKKEEIMSFN